MPFHHGGRFNQGLYDNQSFHNQNSTKGNNHSNHNNQKFWQNKQNQGHQGGNQPWNNNRNNNNRNNHRNRRHWQHRHQNQNYNHNHNHNQNQQRNTPFHKQFEAFLNSNSQEESWTASHDFSSSDSPRSFSRAQGSSQSGLQRNNRFSRRPFSRGDLNEPFEALLAGSLDTSPALPLGQFIAFDGVPRDSHGDVVMADAPQMTTFNFRDHAEDLRTGAKRMMECASDLDGLASFMNCINQSFFPKEQFGNDVYYYG